MFELDIVLGHLYYLQSGAETENIYCRGKPSSERSIYRGPNDLLSLA